MLNPSLQRLNGIMSRTTIDRINSVQWGSYAQPEWNTSTSMAEALERLHQSDTAAYDSVLYAVGNNHAGTYYPVLLAATPFLEHFVRDGNDEQQRIALCILDDLFASFHPEPGHEKIIDPSGTMSSVEATFRKRVADLAPVLAHLAHGCGPNALLASELASMIEQDAL